MLSLCVKLLYVRDGRRRRAEEAEEEARDTESKTRPHTKLWRKKVTVEGVKTKLWCETSLKK